MHHRIYTGFLRLPTLVRILTMALLLVVLFGVIIHLVEPDSFPTIFEGIWWAIITTSTVGYGDYSPESLLGRITGIILIFIGAGFLSTYFITLATTAVSRQNNYLEGKVHFRGDRHLIIIGWNERSKEIIQTIRTIDQFSDIILIDETLSSNPIMDAKVHFIKGRASQDHVLEKANIATAEKVLITADQHKDELDADMNTILALLTIKGLNPNITAIVEVLTRDQMENAKRAGADEIIQSNRMMSYIMTNCIATDGIVSTFVEVLDQLHGSSFSFHPSEGYVSKSFFTANGELLKDGKLLIGIKRGENTMVNPPRETIIHDHDELLIIGQL
ncbi:potassium channel family protein [Robertmurraya korlensis]|uniref:potassium channel family protein n=1 Tax=Robertmurraya korlensis TaxID=519977 RepID=UPI000824389A|nr:potassium channel family protein [Robertmurraya korlensis]